MLIFFFKGKHVSQDGNAAKGAPVKVATMAPALNMNFDQPTLQESIVEAMILSSDLPAPEISAASGIINGTEEAAGPLCPVYSPLINSQDEESTGSIRLIACPESGPSPVTGRVGEAGKQVAPFFPVYSSSLYSQDEESAGGIHLISNGDAHDEPVSSAASASFVTVLRVDTSEETEDEFEEVIRSHSSPISTIDITAFRLFPAALNNEIVLRSPQGGNSPTSLQLANFASYAISRLEFKLWRRLQEQASRGCSPIEWAEIRAGRPENEQESAARRVSICRMAVTWREMKLLENARELASEAYAAESAVSMREIDIANMEDDHAAEVAELNQEISVLKKKLEAQSDELGRVTKKKEQIHFSWKKANREKLQSRKSLTEELAKVTRSEKQAEDAIAKNERLKDDLEAERAKNAALEKQARDAALEASFLHVQCAAYRYEMADQDPARTALFDGLIQRKEEEICRLEDNLRDCQAEIADLRKTKDADEAVFKGRIQGLGEELNERETTLDLEVGSRDKLQEEFEKVAEFFKRKIYAEDAYKVLCDNRNFLREENESLNAELLQRDGKFLNVHEEISSLKADIVDLECRLGVEKRRVDFANSKKA